MSKNNMLEEEARKRRTYNPNPVCPVVKDVVIKVNQPIDFIVTNITVRAGCEHKNIEKKYLFSSSYNVCKDCKEEV